MTMSVIEVKEHVKRHYVLLQMSCYSLLLVVTHVTLPVVTRCYSLLLVVTHVTLLVVTRISSVSQALLKRRVRVPKMRTKGLNASAVRARIMP